MTAIPSREQALYSLRVGMAVAAAHMLSHSSDPAAPLYAVLAAALVMGETTGEGIGISRNRVIGTVAGVIVAIPFTAMGALSVWTLTGACVVAGLVSLVIGEIGVARVAMTVSLVSVMLHPNDVVSYGLYRVTNTAVGVVAALAVGYLFWPLTGRDALPRVMRGVLAEGAELLDTVAASSRADLRQRRQRSLFRALARLPKARKESDQDPVRLWHRPLAPAITTVVAEIGLCALTLSAAIGRLDPARQAAPWWAEVAQALENTAATLRAADNHFSGGPDRAEPAIVGALRLQIAAVDESDRHAVEGFMRDLRSIGERVEELRHCLAAWNRPDGRSAETTA